MCSGGGGDPWLGTGGRKVELKWNGEAGFPVIHESNLDLEMFDWKLPGSLETET